MAEAVGRENMFIFGLTADEVHRALKSGSYRAPASVRVEPALRRVLDMLMNGTLAR